MLAPKIAWQDQLERIIWMPRGLASIDFVRRLNEDEQCQLGAEVIEESLDSLKSYVLDLLKPKPRPEPLDPHQPILCPCRIHRQIGLFDLRRPG